MVSGLTYFVPSHTNTNTHIHTHTQTHTHTHTFIRAHIDLKGQKKNKCSEELVKRTDDGKGKS